MSKRACKIIVTGILVVWVLFIPIVLFLVGSYKQGINLDLADFKNYTFESYKNLLTNSDYSFILFRWGLFRSLIYSLTTSFITTSVAFYFIHWISAWRINKAKEIAFMFLTFALLPQTFFILPVKFLYADNAGTVYSFIIILLSLIIVVIPLTIWISYLIYGEKIRKLITNYSLDILDSKLITSISFKEIKRELLLVASFSFIFTWGNYLIPFALGTNSTNTALVTLTMFSTNLGRNWAMICAAGFTIITPIFIVLLLITVLTKK